MSGVADITPPEVHDSRVTRPAAFPTPPALPVPVVTLGSKHGVRLPAEGPALPQVGRDSLLMARIAMTIAVLMPLVGCAVALALLWQVGWAGWTSIGLLIGGWYLTGMGITIGFHRLLSHRSFSTSSWVRAFWAAMGSMAVEGSPLVWCAVHRKHHQYSDHDGDPHSPHLHGNDWRGVLHGFIHAHLGWLFTREWAHADIDRYVPDLVSDRMLRAIHQHYYVFVLASLAIPTVIAGLVSMSWFGALLGFVWGGLVRIFFAHHMTWSINSICHLFGSREYESGDDSRNNWLFGILAHGEGWHNNHHAFPTSARHGLRWWQIDTSWLVIRGMRRLGLVWNVQTPALGMRPGVDAPPARGSRNPEKRVARKRRAPKRSRTL